MPNNNFNKNNNTVEVKTPYAFVPLPTTVYSPSWADQISQDIPFSDGISGCITFDMISQTPVFVRDGKQKSSFCKSPDGRFFIPATSVKGEMARVLRVMSYGKVGRIADGSFGKRDLNDRTYRDSMINVHCGWMYFTECGVEIEDCDSPARVSLEEIDRHYHTNYQDFVKKSENFRNDYNRTAKKKYDLFPPNRSKKSAFISKKRNNRVDNREIVCFCDYGEKNCFEGEIVFTGQPDVRRNIIDKRTNRRKWVGKYYEFVFPCYDQKETKAVSENVFRAFENIHSSSPDYIEFRKKQLYSGKRIPVFFLTNENGLVESIGLSYLYKHPYKRSIFDAIPAAQRDENKRDLCDCIFGYSTSQQSLKGRVHFGHAFAQEKPKLEDIKEFKMSQPRASFYPFYVKNGKTWDNAEQIAGWKRYPVRVEPEILPSPQGTDAMKTEAAMLPAGTGFKETVFFHNLRPVELGALLSAITFHGNNDSCLHSIGFGKPLGYGAIKIDKLSIQTTCGEKLNPNDMMCAFEKEMTNHDNLWLGSSQLKELLLMAKGIPGDKANSFTYLSTPQEYANLKRNRQGLQSYSERIGKTDFSVKSLIKID